MTHFTPRLVFGLLLTWPFAVAVLPRGAMAHEPPVSCAKARGIAAAANLVRICREASPATRPPCNAANSCAMMEDEIARSCSLFADSNPLPAALCRPDPRSSQAAASVVSLFYAAINAHDYGTAWHQWGANGIPGQAQARFEQGFAKTRSTWVAIGKLAPSEGGAGSIYQDVPVTVEAVLTNGIRQRFTGSYQLRRVNNVDGSSPDQRRWHIVSAHLKPAR